MRLKTGKNNDSSEWICKQSSIDLIKKSHFLSSNFVFSGCFHGAMELMKQRPLELFPSLFAEILKSIFVLCLKF